MGMTKDMTLEKAKWQISCGDCMATIPYGLEPVENVG